MYLVCACHTIVYPVQRVYLSHSNILLSIRHYNVYAYHSPIYHYIIVTAVVYLVQSIAVCVVVIM